jgi:hypothetical protein
MDLKNNGTTRLLRLAALALGLLTLYGDPTLSQTTPGETPRERITNAIIGERFWLAGRYDRNRVVVYFEAVKFNGTFPSAPESIAAPIADSFFQPKVLQASSLARFQEEPGAEHFALGDRYDLLLDGGRVATITLATLVGFESDEFVGNDSYIGALASVPTADLPFFTRDYYAVRRHEATRRVGSTRRTGQRTTFASLGNEPVPLNVQTRVAALIRERLKMDAFYARTAEQTSPSIKEAQRFTVAGGRGRYYVRAELMSSAVCATIGAWFAAAPTLHIVAAEESGCLQDFLPETPRLLNVVDLDGGRTGLILSFMGGDGRKLELFEYRDGAGVTDMRSLQSISFGE